MNTIIYIKERVFNLTKISIPNNIKNFLSLCESINYNPNNNNNNQKIENITYQINTTEVHKNEIMNIIKREIMNNINS